MGYTGCYKYDDLTAMNNNVPWR